MPLPHERDMGQGVAPSGPIKSSDSVRAGTLSSVSDPRSDRPVEGATAILEGGQIRMFFSTSFHSETSSKIT